MNVLLTVCVIMYDTQLIIDRRRHGDDDYILSVLAILYILTYMYIAY